MGWCRRGHWGSVFLLVCGSVDSWPVFGVGMAWEGWGTCAVGFAWCGSVGAVSRHLYCPIFLAVALGVGRFSEDALLQPD